MESEQRLRDDVRSLERKLSDAKDEIVRAGARAQQEEKKAGDEKEVMDRSENQRIVDWHEKTQLLYFHLL